MQERLAGYTWSCSSRGQVHGGYVAQHIPPSSPLSLLLLTQPPRVAMKKVSILTSGQRFMVWPVLRHKRQVRSLADPDLWLERRSFCDDVQQHKI